jgi:hypothetical protein
MSLATPYGRGTAGDFRQNTKDLPPPPGKSHLGALYYFLYQVGNPLMRSIERIFFSQENPAEQWPGAD